MNALVYGYYFKGNIGDELFKDAFKELFPTANLKFVDTISLFDLHNIDAVIFGGGSFVYAEPLIDADALKALKYKRILYIGIGVEKKIHPIHIELMKGAEIIAIRSEGEIEKVKLINPKALFIPDLVFSLSSRMNIAPERVRKSVLILPNIELVPRSSDPNWQHLSWGYFKSEFSQFLDVLVDWNYTIEFLPMCENQNQMDDWAAIEIINKMKNRDSKYLMVNKIKTIEEISFKMSSCESVITQRYHGIVLAEMTKTPYLAIHHHDKLKEAYPGNGTYIPYYGLNKDELVNKFKNLVTKFDSDKNIRERFDILKSNVSLI